MKSYDYGKIELEVYKDVLTGRISKEARDPLEGLAFVVLLLVGIACGVLLGEYLAAVKSTVEGLSSRVNVVEKWKSEADKIIGIEGGEYGPA